MNSNDEEIKLLYLLSGSRDVLPLSCFKLRSYLNIHISNIADNQNLQLLKSFRNRNKTCPYCYSSWSGDTTSFKLFPSKRSRKNRTNRKGESENAALNESRNTLVLKCKVCSKKSSFSLVKRTSIEEKVKADNVEFVKKKKKKKDKLCGLAINLVKPESPSPEIVVIRKKNRMEQTEKTKPTNSANCQDLDSKIPQKHIPIPKNPVGGLVPNPFAAKIQQKFPGKKKDKNLKRLKNAVKEEKNTAKKTLQDFLKLV